MLHFSNKSTCDLWHGWSCVVVVEYINIHVIEKWTTAVWSSVSAWSLQLFLHRQDPGCACRISHSTHRWRSSPGVFLSSILLAIPSPILPDAVEHWIPQKKAPILTPSLLLRCRGVRRVLWSLIFQGCSFHHPSYSLPANWPHMPPTGLPCCFRCSFNGCLRCLRTIAIFGDQRGRMDEAFLACIEWHRGLQISLISY